MIKVSLYPVRLETMPYSIWTNAKISLALLDRSKVLTKRIPITWIPELTIVNSAVLVVSAQSESVYGSTAMRIHMNGNKVVDFVFYSNGTFVDRIDVSALLVNGNHQFDVEFEKNPLINPGAELTLTASIEVTYEGEEPPPPPPPDPWEEWPVWWPVPVVAVIGIIGYGLFSYYK